MSDRIGDDKDKPYILAIGAFITWVLGAVVALIAGIKKYTKIHERMMPECVVAAPAAAAAPGSSYGGGGGMVEPQEKFDCFAGNGYTVAFGVAILLIVVAHAFISRLAGFLTNWTCDCRDSTEYPNREDKNLRAWVVSFHYLTLGLLLLACGFIGLGGMLKYAKEPQICSTTNATAIYEPPKEKRVCSAAWVPVAGAGAVFLHGVSGLFYAAVTLGEVIPPGSGRR